MSDSKEIAKAVGHIPSGLFIVATKTGEQLDGYLASWVQQISFSPLMIAIAINPDRPGYNSIIAGETFTVNIVGDHDMNFLKHFWSGYDPENSPFKVIDHEISSNGGILIKGAKSILECRFKDKIKPGDHELILAEITASYVMNDDSKPKIHIRKSGLDY